MVTYTIVVTRVPDGFEADAIIEDRPGSALGTGATALEAVSEAVGNLVSDSDVDADDTGGS